MQRILWAICTFAAALVLAARSEAFMVTPFNIEELTKRADKVFVGTCQTVSRSVTAQGIPVLEVTFTVSEAVKGEVGKTVTFRQLDPQGQRPTVTKPAPDERLSENPRGLFSVATISGLPNYTPGEEAVLFLTAPGKLGLSAPIGITQGKFPITTLSSGEKVITNTALRNTALPNVSLPGPGNTAQYDRFLSALRTITDANQR